MTSRREFVTAAFTIGGMSGLSACLEYSEQVNTPEEQVFPTGPDDVSTLPKHQHAWSDYIVRDARRNPVFPQYQVALFVEYVGTTPPTSEERNQIETAFQTLERAYQWGTAGEANVARNNGLLFTIAYAPSYFDRFAQSLPASIDVPDPEATLDELEADLDKADSYDAVLHFGSDHPEIVLATEEALFGNLDGLNGVDVESDLTGVFKKAERRAGVIGRGVVRKELDHDGISERSPASMGFKSTFSDNLPTEDSITITDGPFTGGTTQHFSRIEIDLDKWYDVNEEGRVERMFGPDHSVEDVGEVGDELGSSSAITRDEADDTVSDAETKGLVGHTQKTARARNDEFRSRILRRGDFNSPGPSGSVLHFGSLQEGITDFVETRKAMEHLDFDGDDNGDGDENEGMPDIDRDHHGILGFIEVTNRANFLMPPRHLRSLPSPQPTND